MDKETKKTAAPPAGAPKLIRAKVRPGGRYVVGDPSSGERRHYVGGDVVEVTEREYQQSKRTLVTDEDAAAESVRVDKKRAEQTTDDTALFRAFRHRARAAAAQSKAAEDERRRQEMVRLLEATPTDVLKRIVAARESAA